MLEVGTEKLSNIAAPFKKAFGAGAADDAVRGAIRRLATSATGQRALTVLASGLGEGGEEMLQSALEPFLKRAIYDGNALEVYTDPKKRNEYLAQMLYEGAVGFALGAVGGGGQAIIEGGIENVNERGGSPSPDSPTPNKSKLEYVPEGWTDPAEVAHIKKQGWEENALMRQLFPEGFPKDGSMPDNALMRAIFPENNSKNTSGLLGDKERTVYNDIRKEGERHGQNTATDNYKSGLAGSSGIYEQIFGGGLENAAGRAESAAKTQGQIQGTTEQISAFVNGLGNRLSDRGGSSDRQLGLGGYGLSQAQQAELRGAGISPERIRDISQRAGSFVESLKTNASSQRFGACVDTDYTATDLAGSKLYTNTEGTITVGVKPDGDIFGLAKRAGTQGDISEMMYTALLNGGIKCDAYGKRLVEKYAPYGFVPVAKCKYSEAVIRQFNSPEVAEQKIKAFRAMQARGIEPDVYAFVHSGEDIATTAAKTQSNTYKRLTEEQLAGLPTFPSEGYMDMLAYRDSLIPPEMQARAGKPANTSPNQEHSLEPYITKEAEAAGATRGEHEVLPLAAVEAEAQARLGADYAGEVRRLESKYEWDAIDFEVSKSVLERLGKEASATGDYTKLIAWKRKNETQRTRWGQAGRVLSEHARKGFQSTLPVRGVTSPRRSVHIWRLISIHTPREGSDQP